MANQQAKSSLTRSGFTVIAVKIHCKERFNSLISAHNEQHDTDITRTKFLNILMEAYENASS